MPILATPNVGPDVILIENSAGLSFEGLKDSLCATFKNAVVISSQGITCEEVLAKTQTQPDTKNVFIVGDSFDAAKIHELREGLKPKRMGIGGLIIRNGGEAPSAEERVYENVEMPQYHYGFQGETIRRAYMLAVMYVTQTNTAPDDLRANIHRASHLAHIREVSYLATGVK